MILTAVADKEHLLKEWLSLLCKFGHNSGQIVENLELNIDPRIEI